MPDTWYGCSLELAAGDLGKEQVCIKGAGLRTKVYSGMLCFSHIVHCQSLPVFSTMLLHLVLLHLAKTVPIDSVHAGHLAIEACDRNKLPADY